MIREELIAREGLGHKDLMVYNFIRRKRNKLLELDRRFGFTKIEDIDDSLDMALETFSKSQEGRIHELKRAIKRLISLEIERTSLMKFIEEADSHDKLVAQGLAHYVGEQEDLPLEDLE